MSEQSFGTEMRRLRETKGLSLAELADRVHYNKSYLSRVETGRRRPSAILARACDDALGAKGKLAVLAFPAFVLADRSTQAEQQSQGRGKQWSSQDTALVPVLTADGGLTLVRMDRRAFIAATTGATIGATFPNSVAASGEPMRAGEFHVAALIDALSESLECYLCAARGMNPADMSRILAGHITTIDRLLRSASGQTRSKLLRIAARYCEFQGRMLQECGDRAGALFFTDRAVDWANADEWSSMSAYALTRKARLALSDRDSARAIDLARAANANAAPTNYAVRGQALMQMASGYALRRDYSACRQTLDDARRFFALRERNPSAPEDELMLPRGSGDADRLKMVTASCLVDLDRSNEAIDIYSKEIPKIPSTSVRGLAQHNSRYAVAYANAGYPELACQVGLQALDGALITHSATTLEELTRLRGALRRWQTLPAVQELSHRIETTPARS